MTPQEDRRHDAHPNPPEGHERRHCSDTECMGARAQWLEEIIWPKLAQQITANEERLWLKMRIQTAVMIAGTVVFCAGVFLYLSQNAIRDYDLDARDRYTTLTQHQQDMTRIETKIVSLERSVGEHLTDVRKSIDRNLAAIQAIGARR